jgi:dihydroorotase-like cyclic amidohydrolase
MIDIAVHIDSSGFTRWIRRAGTTFESLVSRAFASGVKAALDHARSTTSFKDQSGDLRKTLTSGRKSEWHRFIKAPAKYALFVEEDTKAHRIEAKRARALRFVQAGQVRFARSVWHPGTKGKHFMRDAGQAGEDALQASMRRAAATAFR